MSSPSVSMVTMRGVSGIVRMRGDHPSGIRTAQDPLEGLDVGRQSLFLAELALDVGAAAPARRRPGGAIVEEAAHGVGDLELRCCGYAQALAIDHAVRIDERD